MYCILHSIADLLLEGGEFVGVLGELIYLVGTQLFGPLEALGVS